MGGPRFGEAGDLPNLAGASGPGPRFRETVGETPPHRTETPSVSCSVSFCDIKRVPMSGPVCSGCVQAPILDP
ncbi:hypothetical protein GCM10009755_00800 [Brevibacterium samyangense]|uniref:Uncharacterized protein n=1 Tax=Brevibacterium samyangense TaxID=366888 RepID=A0ABN2T4A2_9MICO